MHDSDGRDPCRGHRRNKEAFRSRGSTDGRVRVLHFIKGFVATAFKMGRQKFPCTPAQLGVRKQRTESI